MLPWFSRRAAAGLFAFALASPMTAWAQDQAPDTSREVFDDWTLVCDNGRRCTAVGLPPGAVRHSESGDELLLMIVRDPGAKAQVRVEIVIPYWEGPGSGARWALVDTAGKPVASTLSASFAPSTHVLRLRLPPTSVAALLSANKEVVLVGASGKSRIALSLIGLKAALTRLDVVQGRSGGVTAIVAKGPRPAGAIPAAPAVPVISKSPHSPAPAPRLKPPRSLIALSAKLSELDVCAGMGGSPEAAIGAPDRLDDRTLLWTIWCTPAGSHGVNDTTVLVVSDIDGRNVRLPTFRGERAPSPTRTILRARTADDALFSTQPFPNFRFDDQTGVLERSDLSVTAAYSNGSFDRYVWTGREMAQFEASEVAIPEIDHRGHAAPYFNVWPPYYRAIVLPAKAARKPAKPAVPPR